MRLISKCQRETLVYWPLIDQDESGQPIFGPPVEMTCRWDDVMTQILDNDGTLKYSRAKLITETALAVGGMVRRGTIANTPYQSGDVRDNTDAYEVAKVAKTPTLNYRKTLYQAWV